MTANNRTQIMGKEGELKSYQKKDVKKPSGDDIDDEIEYYKQVEKLRAAKLVAKAETYSRRKSTASFLRVETLEGRRHITFQMEKNRGLTRIRNKDKKNPRKNYRHKHQKAVKIRMGQVRSIREPTGSYGGESSGINPTISRSIRFKG